MTSCPEAVIFDMDGLMIDSEGNQSAAIETMLREHGAEPVLDETTGVVQIVGMRIEENLIHIKDRHGLDAPIEALHQRKNEIYQKGLAEGVDTMPGLLELLADLRNAPIKKALASGSSKEDIDLVLRHLELENYFDAVVSGYEVAASKPEPDIFLEAAQRLGIEPGLIIVLEDAGVGVQAAKAAGMKAVAVKNQYSEGQDFSEADLTVSSLTELSWKRLQAL